MENYTVTINCALSCFMHVTIIVLHHTFKAVNSLMVVCCFVTINSGWVVVLLVVTIYSSESYHVHVDGETANKLLNFMHIIVSPPDNKLQNYKHNIIIYCVHITCKAIDRG